MCGQSRDVPGQARAAALSRKTGSMVLAYGSATLYERDSGSVYVDPPPLRRGRWPNDLDALEKSWRPSCAGHKSRSTDIPRCIGLVTSKTGGGAAGCGAGD